MSYRNYGSQVPSYNQQKRTINNSDDQSKKRIRIDSDALPDFTQLPTHLPNTKKSSILEQAKVALLPSGVPSSGSQLPTISAATGAATSSSTSHLDNVIQTQPADDINYNLTSETPNTSNNENQAKDVKSDNNYNNNDSNNNNNKDNTSNTSNATSQKNKAPVPVFGTNIVLETEEDIRKWIEERKKKYPTNKRVLEKQQSNAQSISGNNNNSKETAAGNRTNNGSTQLCKFIKNNKKCRFGNKCRFSHDKQTASDTKSTDNDNNNNDRDSSRDTGCSLVPKGVSFSNGSVKEIFGVKTFVPNKFNNTFSMNAGKEKKQFLPKLRNKENLKVNEQVLEFIEDLISSKFSYSDFDLEIGVSENNGAANSKGDRKVLVDDSEEYINGLKRVLFKK